MTVTTKGARALADTSSGTILAEVEIAAPPERVFRAITTDEITKWWGSSDTYRTTSFKADFRPGGAWRSEGVGADGVAFFVEGEFREIDAPRKLVQTWRAPWDGGNETIVTFRLEATPAGTKVTLRHEGFAGRAQSCEGHTVGWERVLGWLATFAAGASAKDTSKYFFCRLVPPRPTFAADMNAAETEVMRAHSNYLRGLLAKGSAVVFGPVGDPAGAWGLGVLRADSDEELKKLTAADPAIESGRGFRYDVLPMMTAVHRT